MMANMKQAADNDEDDDDDENKRDFNLLVKKTKTLDLNSQLSANGTGKNTSHDNEIWPLYLTTNIIDHYILGDVIGNGAYAEVKECINVKNLERCAVKIVDKNYLKRQAPQALANQEQEIKLLNRLKHENIISLKETLYKGSKIYIFLEFCSFVLNDLLLISSTNYELYSFTKNNSINDHLVTDKQYEIDITNSGISFRLVKNLFTQLLTGLDYLHSQNIVHRDIKPHNLLLTTSGILKIIDFGVSQILSLWSWPSDLCRNYEGSPLFQAPEVVSGQLEYAGFKVDVWSAGVTLYLMVHGEYPFMDEALLGLYDKILSEPLRLPDCLVSQHNYKEKHEKEKKNQSCKRNALIVLNDLLAIMMDKEASKRCSISEALKHPWLMLSNTKDNNSNLNDGDNIDEHSEFIELLQHRLASANSSLSFSSSINGNENGRQKKEKFFKTTNLGVNSNLKQRDIYLSMSVLPYLYNHHFPDVPVVKANNRLERKAAEEKEEEGKGGSNVSTLSTTSSSAVSYASSSGTNLSSSSTSNSTSEAHPLKTITTQQQSTTSINSSSPASTGSDYLNSNPNEIISDREIQWGTERQYNLLKLPLIRANRTRERIDRRKAKKRVKIASSSKRTKKRKHKHTCQRRSNDDEDDEDDDDDDIKSIYDKKY